MAKIRTKNPKRHVSLNSLKNLRAPFQPGAKPGPGRPRKKLLDSKLGVLFFRNHKQLARELKDRAERGDNQARAALREFAPIEKPKPQPEKPKAIEPETGSKTFETSRKESDSATLQTLEDNLSTHYAWKKPETVTAEPTQQNHIPGVRDWRAMLEG